MISVHFTDPRAEVVYNGEATFDIASTEEKGNLVTLKSDSKLIKVANVSTVSISYDVAKVDDLSAAKFIKRLNFYLTDPELLML